MTKLKVNKGFNWFVFSLIIAIHFIFLISIFQKSTFSNNLLSSFLFTLTALLLVAGYFAVHETSDAKVEYRAQHNTLHNELSLDSNDFLLILSSVVGAVLTHVAIINIALPTVLLASGITLFVGSLLHMLKNDLFKGADFAFYAGVFFGCTALSWAKGFLGFTVLGGFMVGFMFVLSKNTLIGVGGRLGTFAFMSVWLVDYILSNL